MFSFLKGHHSTESKIRNAINDQPLGPYNKELLDLSILTFDHKALSTITHNLRKKLFKCIKEADFPRRSMTLSRTALSHKRFESGMKRSATVQTTSSSSSQEYNKHLGILKCLTVIVHLCQNGSPAFLQWAKQEYKEIVQPLGRFSFHPKIAIAIYSKVDLISKYCENEADVINARLSLDQLRSELRPGFPDSIGV